MKYSMVAVVFTLLLLCLFACNTTLQCERHFIPNDFTGKVTIYFNHKDGQMQFDKEGCIVYKIPENGECLSALSYKEGTAYPNKTFRYFEVINKDSVKEIPEFYLNEYMQDTLANQQKKYVFFISSGYENKTGSNPNYTFTYAVDYGRNFEKY